MNIDVAKMREHMISQTILEQRFEKTKKSANLLVRPQTSFAAAVAGNRLAIADTVELAAHAAVVVVAAVASMHVIAAAAVVAVA